MAPEATNELNKNDTILIDAAMRGARSQPVGVFESRITSGEAAAIAAFTAANAASRL